MIEIISGEGLQRHAALLEEQHRIRHQIFVGERGWRALARADGHERDAYDNSEATYLLAVEDGRVVGGSRLYPTTSPHMISEVFPHLVEGTIPSGPKILEWSRFFVVRERRGGKTYFELMASAQNYCLDNGITHVTLVMEMWWLPRFLEMEFLVKPLGLPQVIDNMTTAAFIIEINAHSLARVEQLMRLLRQAA
jgi:acyl-homoserine lactone synthase